MNKEEDNIEVIKLFLDSEDTPREVRHAFEEAIHRNVTAIKNFAEDTRLMQRQLQVEIDTLRKQVLMYKGETEEYKQQVAKIQAQLYVGGTN